MKKFFVCAALFIAMFFTVSCGGNGGDDDNSGNNGSQICNYGEYNCDGGNSYFCGYIDGGSDLIWKLAERCDNGCNSVTGQCDSGNGGNNDNGNNNGDNSEYPAADSSYNTNYGFISLNFAFDGIGNADDSGFDSESYEYGYEQGDAYATGTYGNGSAAIAPANAYTFVNQANYYASDNIIQITQNPVFFSDGSYVGGNPIVVMEINANQAAVGKMSVGLDDSNPVTLYVVEENWNTHQLKCIHAFAEGQINISKLGDLVYHGALELTGALQLYSPKNFHGSDVSSVFRVDTCAAVY